MPSDASLEKKEYYGHTRNRFWRIISEITQSETPLHYEGKIELLVKHKIGLWDIAQKAERKGSLDSSMKDVIPNKLEEFLQNHPKIHTICFNGIKAQKLHDQFFLRKSKIKYLLLPSSSPANARMSIDALISYWREIL